MVKILYLNSIKTCAKAAKENYKLFGSSTPILGY